jgi:signal peptidase II
MTRYGLFLGAALFALDHGTKWWIRERVMNPPRVIPVTGFFNLTLNYNKGISFGLFGSTGLPSFAFALIAFVVSAALLFWLLRTRNRLVATGLGLLIGGALANGIDRLWLGAVTDFLDFHAGGWHWPAFNVADIGVVCGAGGLVLDSFRPGYSKANLTS